MGSESVWISESYRSIPTPKHIKKYKKKKNRYDTVTKWTNCCHAAALEGQGVCESLHTRTQLFAASLVDTQSMPRAWHVNPRSAIVFINVVWLFLEDIEGWQRGALHVLDVSIVCVHGEWHFETWCWKDLLWWTPVTLSQLKKMCQDICSILSQICMSRSATVSTTQRSMNVNINSRTL